MFAKKFRLPSNQPTSLFQVVHTPLFVLKYNPNKEGSNRYGFIASKKVDKRAVYRNKAKRHIRGLLEEMNTTLRQGHDFLFVLKPLLKEETREKVMETLQNTLKNILV